MRRFAILFMVAVVLSSCRYISSHKEGAVHYKITYSGNLGGQNRLMPTSMMLNFKNDMLRMKMLGGLGKLIPAAVINGQKGEITMPGDSGKRRLSAPDTSLKTNGKQEMILGHECTLYVASNKNTHYTVWAADDMLCTIKGTSRLNGFYLAGYAKIPLKIIDKEQDFEVDYMADSLSATMQSDSLFSATGR